MAMMGNIRRRVRVMGAVLLMLAVQSRAIYATYRILGQCLSHAIINEFVISGQRRLYP